MNVSYTALTVSLSNGYFAGPDPLNFADGEAFCRSQGSNLATVTCKEDLIAVQELCKDVDTYKSMGCAMGLFRPNAGEPWRWRDGSEIDYGFINNNPLKPNSGKGPWNAGEPNDAGGNEDCIELQEYKDYKFNDVPCINLTPLPIPICNGMIT